MPAESNWNRVCDAFISGNKWSFLTLLFVGGGSGCSLTVGIKACRRRCWSEWLARGGPERGGWRPPSVWVGPSALERCPRNPGHRRPRDTGGPVSDIPFLDIFETVRFWAQMWLHVEYHASCSLIVTREITYRSRVLY